MRLMSARGWPEWAKFIFAFTVAPFKYVVPLVFGWVSVRLLPTAPVHIMAAAIIVVFLASIAAYITFLTRLFSY